MKGIVWDFKDPKKFGRDVNVYGSFVFEKLIWKLPFSQINC